MGAGICSEEVLSKCKSDISANINNLHKVISEKDLIDIISGTVIEIQELVFEYWLKCVYK